MEDTERVKLPFLGAENWDDDKDRLVFSGITSTFSSSDIIVFRPFLFYAERNYVFLRGAFCSSRRDLESSRVVEVEEVINVCGAKNIPSVSQTICGRVSQF